MNTDYTQEYMVDYCGKKEVLYLGPDEQVLPEDIDWIIQRAAQRGYGTPAAFMSSKPKAGCVFVCVRVARGVAFCCCDSHFIIVIALFSFVPFGTGSITRNTE